MANIPLFVGTSNIGTARPTAFNAASDGSGTVGTDIFNLVTAAAGGTRVDRISIRNSQNTYGASVALVVRFYIFDGSITRLIEESLIPSASARLAAGPIGAAGAVYFPGGLFMKSGQILRCSVSVYSALSQVDIVAYGGDM